MNIIKNKAIIPQTVFDFTCYFEEELSSNLVAVSSSKYPKLKELVNAIDWNLASTDINNITWFIFPTIIDLRFDYTKSNPSPVTRRDWSGFSIYCGCINENPVSMIQFKSILLGNKPGQSLESYITAYSNFTLITTDNWNSVTIQVPATID